MMENMLDDIAYGFSESGAELFDSVYAGFEESASVTAEEQQRILSSVMRKAGFEMKESISMKKTKRSRKRIIVGIVAAAVLLTSAVGAYASGELDIFDKFFNGDISSFESELKNTVQSVSNDDIILSIDGIIADEAECQVIVSVYAKNSEGRKIIKMLSAKPNKQLEYGYDNSQLFLKHNGPKHFDGISYEDSELIRPPLNNRNEFHCVKQIEMSNIDRSQPFTIIEQESGLSIEFDISPYLESYRLTSDDDMAFDYVVLSSSGVHIRPTEKDIESGRYFDFGIGSRNLKVYVNYADGTSRELEAVESYKNSRFDPNEENAEENTWQKLHDEERIIDAAIDARTIVDGVYGFIPIENVVSVTIDGIEYMKDQ